MARRRWTWTAVGALAAAMLIGVPAANAAAPALKLAPLAPRFAGPIWVGGAGDGTSTLYVAEQRGVIWKVAGAKKVKLLDISSTIATGGEQGLLSIGFAHDFAKSGRMFVWATAKNGTGEARQFRVAKGKIVPGSGRVVIRVPLSPPTATNHNGGSVVPLRDGSILVSTGDGGDGGDPNNNAQNLSRLMGKILRVTPKANGGYTIPKNNPFVGRAGARAEIWALGLRNPWRISVDAATNDLWIGDVGQGEFEEIDVVRGNRAVGANFGWGRFEGNAVFDSSRTLTSGTRYVKPIHTYSHAAGGCSVTGGVVYRGPVRALRGTYLFADFCRPVVTVLSGSGAVRGTRPGVSGIVHFGAGTRTGDVFVASNQTGRVYKVVGA